MFKYDDLLILEAQNKQNKNKINTKYIPQSQINSKLSKKKLKKSVRENEWN